MVVKIINSLTLKMLRINNGHAVNTLIETLHLKRRETL